MNRLIIIGNGFDLSCDLKTGYHHFFKVYLQKCILENKVSNLFQWTSSISHTNHFNVSEISTKEILDLYTKHKIYVNATNDGLFASDLLQAIKIENWVDIEKIYFNCILKQLLRLQNGAKLNFETRDDVEEQVYEINKEFKILTDAFIEYLNKEVLNNDLEIKNKFDENVRKILFCDNYYSFQHGDGYFHKNNTLILNFNYTNTLKEIKGNQLNTEIINLHGDLSNIENNPVIFGYGDYNHEKYNELERANIQELLKNIKSNNYLLTDNYKKLIHFLETGIVQTEKGQSVTMLKNEFEVLVYGHSCGLSDSNILKTIFNHENCKKIHVAYFNDKDDYFKKTIEIGRHFDSKEMFLNKLQTFNEKLKIPQNCYVN